MLNAACTAVTEILLTTTAPYFKIEKYMFIYIMLNVYYVCIQPIRR